MDLFTKSSFVKINVKGGILSPGTLKEITSSAKKLQVKELYFGERQNIYLRTYLQVSDIESFKDELGKFDFEINQQNHPNIISSYVSEDIFTSKNNWLGEGIYKDVLDSFDYRPKCKINIVDNSQGLVPLFTGNLNFISSEQSNFWYLFVKHSSFEGIQCWPELIYTGDISTLAKALEGELSVNNTVKANLLQLSKILNNSIRINTVPIRQELILPRLRFPNYEGMNKEGENYWLGIYRRSYSFQIEFLEKVAELCLECKLGAVYLTPFKSLIIKGIKEDDRFKWEKLLGEYGVNIRHNISELIWKVRDLDDSAVKLKMFLSKSMDNEDVRTYGLTFSIKSGPMDVASSVIIEKEYEINLFNKIKLLPRYSVYYLPNFDPNRQDPILFSRKITKYILADDLMILCRKYYAELTKENSSSGTQVEKKESEKEKPSITHSYQCQECFTVYNEQYGDSLASILPGTSFNLLPPTWNCPVCEAPKSSFHNKNADKTKVLA
ncbi:MAG: rubredoxin domain-containing protein [Opitutaceae bacterium]|nr:rubredoxin domain-containing protein [Cytophagales bacterium]